MPRRSKRTAVEASSESSNKSKRLKNQHPKTKSTACNHCEEAFPTRLRLLRHEKKCEKRISRMSHEERLNFNKDIEKFICRTCNKTYEFLFALKKHEKRHIPPGGFICKLCGSCFTSEENRTTHREQTHKTFKCMICEAKFEDDDEYLEHIHQSHNGKDREYFICADCGRQFRLQIQLKNHNASKCGTTKTYTCTECNSMFMTKYTLNAHKLIHVGEKKHLCNFCGSKFLNKGQLKVHERSHTGEKPFTCEVCEKSFAYRESLVTHSSLHTGIKPYQCECCSSRFSCIGNLIKHRRARPETCGLPEYSKNSKIAPRASVKNTGSLTLQKPVLPKKPKPKRGVCKYESKTGEKSDETVLENISETQSPEQSILRSEQTFENDISFEEEMANYKNLEPVPAVKIENFVLKNTSAVEKDETSIENLHPAVKDKIIDLNDFSKSTLNTHLVLKSTHRVGGDKQVTTVQKMIEQTSSMPSTSVLAAMSQSGEENQCIVQSDEYQAQNTDTLLLLKPLKVEMISRKEDIKKNRNELIVSESIVSIEKDPLALQANAEYQASEVFIIESHNKDPLAVHDNIDYQPGPPFIIDYTELKQFADLQDKIISHDEVSHSLEHGGNAMFEAEIVIKHEKTCETPVLAFFQPAYANEQIFDPFNQEEKSTKPCLEPINVINIQSDKVEEGEESHCNTSLIDSVEKSVMAEPTRKSTLRNNSKPIPESLSDFENGAIDYAIESETDDHFVDTSFNDDSSVENNNESNISIDKNDTDWYTIDCEEGDKPVSGKRAKKSRVLHSCQYCHKTFSNSLCLAKHKKDHGPGGKLLFKCSCCKLFFSTKSEMKQHQNVQHRDKLYCADCDKFYSEPGSLKAHIKFSHKKVRKPTKYLFMCISCGKNFTSKVALNDHERAKCGTSPFYKCEVCQKFYHSAGSLKTHMTLHTGELPHVCKYCGKGHRTQGQARVHERVHSGEKPFKCEFCPKAFSHRESQLTHLSLHTGLKRFMCQSCGNRFSCISNLQAHRRTNKTTCGMQPNMTKAVGPMGLLEPNELSKLQGTVSTTSSSSKP